MLPLHDISGAANTVKNLKGVPWPAPLVGEPPAPPIHSYPYPNSMQQMPAIGGPMMVPHQGAHMTGFHGEMRPVGQGEFYPGGGPGPDNGGAGGGHWVVGNSAPSASMMSEGPNPMVR